MTEIIYTDSDAAYWKTWAFWSGIMKAAVSILKQVTETLLSIQKRVTNYFYFARMKTIFVGKPFQKNL